jgi:hypothetical protein
MECAGDVVTVIGTTMWSRLSKSLKDSHGNIIPIYSAGLKFTDISDEKISEIEKFIKIHMLNVLKQTNIYRPDGLRLYVRVPLENPEQASILYHEDCKVKELSLSGMLIESENAIEVEKKTPMEVRLTKNKSVTLQGRIVLCKLVKDKYPDLYNVGIEIVEISEDDKEILKSFIQLLETIDKSPP